MDEAASNYEPFFNVDDGSCRLPGCLATNPNAAFNVPSMCPGGRRELRGRQLSTGCMDPAATNYDSAATSQRLRSDYAAIRQRLSSYWHNCGAFKQRSGTTAQRLSTVGAGFKQLSGKQRLNNQHQSLLRN